MLYEFAGFNLDRDERVLRRGDAVVPLTPKATEILLALVERPGHLVEKADLMRQVWADTAVEDSNLTQNIYTLRKVLGDGEGKGRFIDTVPRRGYRFVAPVREVSERPQVAVAPEAVSGNNSELGQPLPDPARVERSRHRTGTHRRIGWIVVTLAGGLAGAAVFGLTPSRSRSGGPSPEPTVRLSPLTNVGTVVRAAISGDGRSLAYAVSTGARESLLVKDLDSANSVQLIEPAVGTYRRGGGISYAPNGWVYYTWFRADLATVGTFRIQARGGQPERLQNVWGLPSFDRRSARFACITTTSTNISDSRLVVYNAAGDSPRVVAMRTAPMTFLQMMPAWSPDGTQLAAWTLDERTPGVRDLVIVDVDNGRERVITNQRLHSVDGVVWSADGASVIVAAREQASSPLRLWQIPLAEPGLRPLTTDVSDYLLAGLTDDGRRLAAVRVDAARTLWIGPIADPSQAKQVISDARELGELDSIDWMPNGRLLYTSTESGNADIWVFDQRNGTRRQLTTNPRDDFNPTSSPDGRTIVFASDRSGATGLWTMSETESSARQLTNGGDSRPSVSADGRVVFQRGIIQSSPTAFWRIPLQGGTPVQLTDGTTIRPAVSPDGRLVAHYWLMPERWALAVVRLDDGQPVHVFPLSSTHCGRTVRWSPDSRALAYIDCDGGVGNIWLQRLDGSVPHKLTQFTSGNIATFDWSRDGSQLAWITRSRVSDVVLIELGGRVPGS